MSFKTRAITGLTFAGIIVGLCLAHFWSCVIMLFLAAALCLWEFSGLVLVQDGAAHHNAFRRIWMMVLGIVPCVFVLLSAFKIDIPLEAILVLLPFTFLFFIFELFAKSEKPFQNLAHVMLGVVYISIPFSLFIVLCTSLVNANQAGNHFILSVLLMIWAGDTGAYMLGSKIGKSKMFPRISPKKTWEGTFSGVLAAMIVGILCWLIFTDVRLDWWQWEIIAAICALFGVLGDLVESMLKRSLNIKDSGNILPGHGGFLDRFDSFMFVQPFVFFAMMLF